MSITTTDRDSFGIAINDYHTEYTSETVNGSPIAFSGSDVSKKLKDHWVITDDDLEMVKVKVPIKAQSPEDQIDAIYKQVGVNGCIQNKFLDSFTNAEIAMSGFVPWIDGFYYNQSLDSSKNSDF